MAEEIGREGGAFRPEAAGTGDMMDTKMRGEIFGKTALEGKADEGNFSDKTLTEQIQQLKEVQAEMKKAKKEAVKK